MVSVLPVALATELSRASFTYEEVGATALQTLPEGYAQLQRTRALPGRTFEQAAEQLLGWQVHERVGLRVAASAPRAAEGVVVLMRLGFGSVSLRIPCRVVYQVDQPDRIGFAYGTLPGHPEQGEELFLLERDDAAEVQLRIVAFSRPATRLARAGGPVSRWVQAKMTDRYLAALEQR